MRGSSADRPVNQSVQVNSTLTPEVSVSNIAGYLILSIPIVLLISIIGHKKYRTVAHRRRIES
ncbi:MAG: hypothetical protein HC903_19340 [Methylacidiphilales bacterium]|nr:hypothetical protein [Candidatus Methylacidiphilales bacterium]